jgi:biopolymer transport protein ExbB
MAVVILAALLFGVAAPAFAADGLAAKDVSVWTLIRQGGWLMIPIGLCSLAGLAYALERFLNLRLAKIMPARLVASLEEAIGRRDYEAAKTLCRTNKSPFAQIFLAGSRMPWRMPACARSRSSARTCAPCASSASSPRCWACSARSKA